MYDPLIHVTRLDQAIEMMTIRNTCREFMTGNPEPITPEQQRVWFDIIKGSPDWLPFLFEPGRARHQPGIIGYGLIRREHQKWWVSGGLLPHARGFGLGQQLFGELAHYVHEAFRAPAYLTVWQSNERAWRAYIKVGFYCLPPIVQPDGRVMLEMRMDP